jgi:hypothetical protein
MIIHILFYFQYFLTTLYIYFHDTDTVQASYIDSIIAIYTSEVHTIIEIQLHKWGTYDNWD